MNIVRDIVLITTLCAWRPPLCVHVQDVSCVHVSPHTRRTFDVVTEDWSWVPLSLATLQRPDVSTGDMDDFW